jgi:glycosyltransferase involved in cell wall biosynthesis
MALRQYLEAMEVVMLSVGGGRESTRQNLSDQSELELSVVIPCLNEADTLGKCIMKAWQALREHNIPGEIIVADNGSTDGSRAIASALSARVIDVTERGYGRALMGGISAALGKFIIMGDADDSYDFGEIPKFVDKLREGYEMVQGCRLPSGGGRVLPGAMPFLHRWWGNPMFTLMARTWFRSPVHDIYCGLRGFTKEVYERLNQRCAGMEFATEMIIKSSLYGVRMTEVPISLHPDGRRSHPPHLKTFRDGWRTLRFFLMYSPRWLFLMPGFALILCGLLGYAVALPGLMIDGVTFDAHTLLFASLALICSEQAILFALFTRVFAANEGLMPESARLRRFFRLVNLERGVIAGFLPLVFGLSLLLIAVNQWRVTHFGHLDYSYTMRWVIPGATLTALGFQTILASFVMGILGMRRS